MLKAIIALINKWAYRCEHEWVMETKAELTRGNSSDVKGLMSIYRCEKCCEFKTNKEYS